ncbi:hypothetical protein [Phenylobacterium sp.]|uniref:hypothetical protein n=1 Tax=Phenylobacterium sp. TaxID=1871053 RepID=UPI002DED303E|nr:hypothetical protein [Phenylobacterium sp.]
MKNLLTIAASVAILALGLRFYFHENSQRSDLLPTLAGCFQGREQLAGTTLTVSPNGRAALYGQEFTVTPIEDKIGLSLRPSRGIVFDANSPSKLIIGARQLLLRLSADRRTVTIPGDAGGAELQRQPCDGVRPDRRD